MILDKIINFFDNPITALISIILFALVFFIYNASTNNIHNNFFSFGPTKDENDKSVMFLGAYLDTWGHVIIAYILIFLASVFSNYYTNVMNHNIFNLSRNLAIIDIKTNKLLTYIITMIDPFINTLLYIITFYATASFQIQYIIPQFLGSYIMHLPFALRSLGNKKFL